MNLFPVIMAGGSGTRFWPLSRAARPKQFLALVSERPLIAETIQRLRGLAQLKDVRVVCGKRHAALVRRATKLSASSIWVEPEPRNTAPALALASARIAAKDPQGVIIALPSDQHIRDEAAFRAALTEAAELALEGLIVTVGITPTRPETGFGYIRLGAPLRGNARRADRFVEKPDLATAQGYLASREYLWNGGIFVFQAKAMLAALRAHAPEFGPGLDALGRAGKRFDAALPKAFRSWPSISIDYAVAEKAQNVAVIPGDFGWSDVGSFEAVSDVRARDAEGNVSTGEALLIDSRDSVVLAGSRLVAVVGVEGLVVVDAGDAVLVIPKKRSQDVRKVIEQLKATKRERYL